MKIEAVCFFDYSSNVGYYQSVRDFRTEEMTYIELALSTSEIKVNAEPIKFKLNAEDSAQIREFIISQLDELKEISEFLAENSPKYIMVSFADDSKLYYEYNESFCSVFDVKNKYNEKESHFPNTNSFTIQQPILETNQFQRLVSSEKVVNDSQKTQYENESKRLSPLMRLIAGVLIIIVFIVGMSVAFIKPDSYDDTTEYLDEEYTDETSIYEILTPENEPESGTVLYGEEVYDGSELTINTSSDSACLIKLKDSEFNEVLSFYVRANDTVTVAVPREYLYVYFASGTTWYGEEYLFGEKTSYSMDDEISDFYNYTSEYTLYSVSNGNFQQTPIEASEF